MRRLRRAALGGMATPVVSLRSDYRLKPQEPFGLTAPSDHANGRCERNSSSVIAVLGSASC